MLTHWLSAFAALLALLAGWTAVQAVARRFARKHPECGAYQEAGGGCGGCGQSCAHAPNPPDAAHPQRPPEPCD